MPKLYRQGAVGALLDEYERAIAELKLVLADISDKDLIKTVDYETSDTCCTSVQTILSHVVSAGINYAKYIRKFLGHEVEFADDVFHISVTRYIEDLTDVFSLTAETFNNIQDSQLEEFDNSKKVMTSWGQIYDIEQITEHAIVHILRHRRQIEKFKILLNTK